MQHDPNIGIIIRKVRTDRKMTQEKLANKIRCTSGALSRFERGKLALEKENIDLLMKELGVTTEDIPSILEQIEEDESVRLLTFLAVETQVKHGLPKTKKEFMEKLALIEQPIVKRYLRGKRCFVEKDYSNAIKQYQFVLDTHDDDYCPKANLKASTYLDLGVIAYHKDDYPTAFDYLEKGIECFDQAGERRHVWHGLHYNKSMFQYELVGRSMEGSAVDLALDPVWSERDRMDDVLGKIKVYELKASIKRDSGKYDEARKILQHALRIATVNSNADGSYYILVDLAKLALEAGHEDYSVNCFNAALELKGKLNKTKPTSAYLGLGKLYLHQGSTKPAKKLINKALKHARKSKKDIHQLIQAYIVLGNIYEKDENKYDSSENYKKALKLAVEYEFTQYKPELYEYIYRCKN